MICRTSIYKFWYNFDTAAFISISRDRNILYSPRLTPQVLRFYPIPHFPHCKIDKIEGKIHATSLTLRPRSSSIFDFSLDYRNCKFIWLHIKNIKNVLVILNISSVKGVMIKNISILRAIFLSINSKREKSI